MASNQNTTSRCECGNRKGSRATCCQRCKFLDGVFPTERVIIGVMRERTRVTVRDLVDRLGVAQESAHRMLMRLVRMGRARADIGETEAFSFCLVTPRGM